VIIRRMVLIMMHDCEYHKNGASHDDVVIIMRMVRMTVICGDAWEWDEEGNDDDCDGTVHEYTY
jgi:hypothetical protein